MAGSRRLVVELLGDSSGLSKAFGKADDASGALETSLGGLGKKIALGVAGVVSVGEAFSFLKSSARDAAEDESQQTIFEKSLQLAGGSQKVIDAFNAQIAAGQKLKGFTDTDLRNAYAQAFAQSKDVAKSQQDVALAMDIARKSGQPLEAVMDAISKAHNGQTRALKSMLPEFGALITNASSAQGALDALAVATKGSADAWAGSTEGQMAKASIRFGEFKEQIGSALLPVLAKLADFATTTLIPAMSQVADWVAAHWPQIRDTIVGAVETVWGYVAPVIAAFQDAWNLLGDNILNWMRATWENVTQVVSGAFDAIRGVFRLFRDLFTGDWSKLWDDLVQIVSGLGRVLMGAVSGVWEIIKLYVGVAWDAIKGVVFDAWDAIVEVVTGMPDRIAKAAAGMWDGIKDAFRAALNFIIRGWNALEFRVPGFKVGPVGFDGFTLGVPDIPMLASGGIVTRPTLAMIGEAGAEAVVPLTRGRGFGGDTYAITVNAGLGTDGADVGRRIVEVLRAYRRGNGPIGGIVA